MSPLIKNTQNSTINPKGWDVTKSLEGTNRREFYVIVGLFLILEFV